MKANDDIRIFAKNNGICLWQIAEKLGMTDYAFSRKLRNEFSPKEKEKIKNIILELSMK